MGCCFQWVPSPLSIKLILNTQIGAEILQSLLFSGHVSTALTPPNSRNHFCCHNSFSAPIRKSVGRWQQDQTTSVNDKKNLKIRITCKAAGYIALCTQTPARHTQQGPAHLAQFRAASQSHRSLVWTTQVPPVNVSGPGWWLHHLSQCPQPEHKHLNSSTSP